MSGFDDGSCNSDGHSGDGRIVGLDCVLILSGFGDGSCDGNSDGGGGRIVANFSFYSQKK